MNPYESPICSINKPINVVMECGISARLKLADVGNIHSKFTECRLIVELDAELKIGERKNALRNWSFIENTVK